MTDWYVGQRVLVTGASGFIGGTLCRRLHNSGAEIHAISRAVRESGEIRWWQGDLTSFGVVDYLIARIRPDTVFHLAGEVTGSRDLPLILKTLQHNLVSTVNLLTSLAEHGCQAVVLAGSMEEPCEGEDTPGSPYAASKWACSGYARMFSALYHLRVVTARIFMTYGPAQPDRMKLIPYVTDCLLRGEAPQLTTGERLVDWVYVDDVVDGLLAAATSSRATGKTLDLGSGTLVPIRAVVEQLVLLTNPDVTPVFGALPARPMEHSRVANTEASRVLLGWRPVHTLEQGLAKTVAWHRKHPQPAVSVTQSL